MMPQGTAQSERIKSHKQRESADEMSADFFVRFVCTFLPMTV